MGKRLDRFPTNCARVAELVDAGDLDSPVSVQPRGVQVRILSWAHQLFNDYKWPIHLPIGSR